MDKEFATALIGLSGLALMLLVPIFVWGWAGVAVSTFTIGLIMFVGALVESDK